MIGVIEQAIIDRLKAADATGVLGYRWGAVASYSGELDAEVITNVTRGRFPMAWVVFAGDRRRDTAQGELRETQYALLVAARGGRNEQEGRHGSNDRVGAYQLVRDARGLLADQTLGLDIVPIQVTGTRTVFNGAVKGDPLAVYALDLVTGYRATPLPNAASLDDFETFHADWDLAPRDGQIDAADIVTLPIQEAS
jgi:phage gp37-like protein